MAPRRTLLHVCCANCMFDTLDALRKADLRLSVLFYNPNIQPLLEYRRRRKSFLLAAERLNLDIVSLPVVSPDPRLFLEQVQWRETGPKRCASCYRMRLEETARAARDNGFDAFLSTLQVSTHQQHELVLEAGRHAADEYDVQFMETDLREHFGKGRLPSGFHPYRQQYCGCLMSEFERFAPTKQHLVKREEAQ